MSHPLVINTFPLKGSRLIEASAGTGKTYTIALLYVRLVLQHGGSHAFVRELMPPEILVVTFTEAASQELCDRIRARLTQAAQAFSDAGYRETVDDELKKLISDYDASEHTVCAMKLQRAAEWMDEAAISTIHGWCYRMLREHAFDSQHLFTQELLTNQDELLLEVVEDYWRQYFYALNVNTAEALLEKISSPEKLLSAIRPLLSANHTALLYKSQSLDSKDLSVDGFSHWVTSRVEQIDAVKTIWRTNKEAIEALLRERWGDFNGTKHGKVDEVLSGIVSWADGNNAGLPKKLLIMQTGAFSFKKAAKNQEQPQHAVFDAIAELAKFSEDKFQYWLAALKCHAAHWVQIELEKRLAHRAELGFDDMLIRLQRALASDSGERLAGAIREQFPVALIDEFQDTDPVQYGIFNAIYSVASNDESTALVMIGDPKQAIYAFRGADIYTYLKARTATEGRHYTLSKNFRSTQAIVTEVNKLFAHAEEHERGAFRFKKGNDNPVPFVEVACADRKEQLLINDKVQPAVTGWWLPGVNEHQVTGPGDYRVAMAQVAANEVVRWLELAKIKKAGFAEKDKPFQALQPKDIAILVRSGAEARAIRHALTDCGVASVYLSDRDSVFASAEAPDVLRWLRAVAEPDNARLLKPALASAGLALPLPELANIFDSESEWEQTVLRFREYRELWQKRGVLPMLRRLLADYAVASHWLQRDDGERALTNLLHIAEWLQQQSHSVDGEQALIRLLADKIAHPSEQDVLRLESDADLVKVITIHKSKGLEYPLVLLPFVCAHKKQNSDVVTYHQYDEKTGEYHALTELAGAANTPADDERLSEDMRLLYVAFTRARHALWLGITPLSDAKNKKDTNLEYSALGYLVQGGQTLVSEKMADYFPANVIAWKNLPVFSELLQLPTKKYTAPTNTVLLSAAREMPRKAVTEQWWVASYSALKAGKTQSLSGREDVEPEPEDSQQDTASEETGVEGAHGSQSMPTNNGNRTMHQFPRGPTSGTFLHSLLEWAAKKGFAKVVNDSEMRRKFITQCCSQRQWDKWIDTLYSWLENLLKAALPIDIKISQKTLCLMEVSRCLSEMEFWFESHSVDAMTLNDCVHRHTLGGVDRPQLNNTLLNGMLKGFIDLVFEFDGKYFVADWKSNWLGEQADCYTAENMRDAILHHRYELQYTLYILALHRHLQDRLPDYDYDQHIGGAVYVFLRGVENSVTRGVHFEKPPRVLIEQLDALFAGSRQECVA